MEQGLGRWGGGWWVGLGDERRVRSWRGGGVGLLLDFTWVFLTRYFNWVCVYVCVWGAGGGGGGGGGVTVF